MYFKRYLTTLSLCVVVETGVWQPDAIPTSFEHHSAFNVWDFHQHLQSITCYDKVIIIEGWDHTLSIDNYLKIAKINIECFTLFVYLEYI